MAITARTRLVNPRLGTYFGIFTAAFAALFVLALMFEQLGASDGLLRLLMFGGPIVLYAAIGLSSSATRGPRFLCLRAQSACFLQRAGARHYRARRRRLPGADRVIVHDRLRRGVPQHRLLCRSRLHGSAVRAVHAQARSLHAADVPRAPFREPHRAHRRGGSAVRAHPPTSGGRGPVCRLCCGVAPGAVGAPDGAAGRGLRRRHRDCGRHALADLVERGAGHRRAAGAGGAGNHHRSHGLQSAPAADDAWQRAAHRDQGRDRQRRADRARASAGVRLSGRRRRAADQAVRAVLRQRRQPELRADVVRGGVPALPPRPPSCRDRGPRPASTRRANRWVGRCSCPASCC